ncbi:hypothetical protein GCM10009665_58830 [Kitasatospora nipponensis]|uniref:Uncharacterized protein n=1 Tax=Kitasatospora nipponensis TaxID=258049 RepID=A0ABN1WR17_9ACTN
MEETQSGDEAILDALRTIRGYLPNLVGAAEAAEIDRELADLLARPPLDTATVVARGLEVLQRHNATLEWAATYLDSGYPPDIRALIEQRERYAGLPGQGDPPPAARRYRCPNGDYVRWRRGAEVLRPCPTHHLPLVPEPVVPGEARC